MITASNALVTALIGVCSSPIEAGTTTFSELSEEAQDLIVRAVLGEFEDGPPEISEEVRDEIALWASSP